MSWTLVPRRIRRRPRRPESVTIVADWHFVYDLSALDGYYGAHGRCEGMGV